MMLKPRPWKICLLLKSIILVSQLMNSMPAHAQNAQARPESTRVIDFSIEATSLVRALNQFAAAAGITLSYASSLLRDQRSAGLHGRHEVQAALSLLLRGSGLDFRRLANGDYVLVAAAAGSSGNGGGALPAVQVHAGRPSSFQTPASVSTPWSADALDTPRQTSVIGADLLRETGAVSLTQALRNVPGLSFRGADAGTVAAGDRPIIRGFDAGSAILIDGMRNAGPQSRDLFAVEQVEVLEGPASIYSGRGSGGGSVNLVSKQPLRRDQVQAELGMGSANYGRGSLDVNRVLDPGTAVRLNLMWQDSAKAGREQVTYQRRGVAPSISFGMNTPDLVTLGFYHLELDDMPDYSVPYTRGGGAPLNVAGTPFLGLLARDYLRSSTDIWQLQWTRRLDPQLTLRNATQYTQVRQSFVASNPQWADAGGELLALQAKSGLFDQQAFVHQSELAGQHRIGGLAHDWLAGLELSAQRGARNTYDIRDESGNSLTGGATCSVAGNCTTLAGWNPASPWTGVVGSPIAASAVTTITRTASLYAQDTIALSPAWLLNGGLRYERFVTRADSQASGVLRASTGDLNYQLGIIHKPGANLSLYGVLSTASNPVGADAGVGSDAISLTTRGLAPERSRGMEAGIKFDWPQRALSLNASVFRTTKDNARISVSRDAITGARQSLRGVQLSLRGNLTPDWKVSAAMALLDSHIDDGGSDPRQSGNAFPMTPRQSLVLWSSHRLAAGWDAGAGLTYNARMYANVPNTNIVPAYTRLDAMLSWQASERVAVQLNITNLSDKRYYDVAYPVYASVAARRAAVLTAHLKF
jgi:catecholate siderophore receptor